MYNSEYNSHTLHFFPDFEGFDSANRSVIESDYDEYELKINYGIWNIGENYIHDLRESSYGDMNWYHIKIPLTGNAHVRHSDDLYLRIYLTGFKNHIATRIVEFELK